MDSIKCIKDICEKFKLGIYTIDEFQGRLQTVVIEDELNLPLRKILNDADNKLETILFCELENNYYECGCKVADYLINNLLSK